MAKSKLKKIYKQIQEGVDVWIEFSEGGDAVPDNYLSLTFRINDTDCIMIELAERKDGEQEYNLYKGKYRSPELLDGTVKVI